MNPIAVLAFLMGINTADPAPRQDPRPSKEQSMEASKGEPQSQKPRPGGKKRFGGTGGWDYN
jgi:hypothetical protein